MLATSTDPLSSQAVAMATILDPAQKLPRGRPGREWRAREKSLHFLGARVIATATDWVPRGSVQPANTALVVGRDHVGTSIDVLLMSIDDHRVELLFGDGTPRPDVVILRHSAVHKQSTHAAVHDGDVHGHPAKVAMHVFASVDVMRWQLMAVRQRHPKAQEVPCTGTFKNMVLKNTLLHASWVPPASNKKPEKHNLDSPRSPNPLAKGYIFLAFGQNI